MTSTPTAPLVAAGLIGGFSTARYSGHRPLGGVVLAAAGAYCTRQWIAQKGPVVGGSLLVAYLVAFGGSHPLAKKIGAWPSVLAVSAATAGVTHVVADR